MSVTWFVLGLCVDLLVKGLSDLGVLLGFHGDFGKIFYFKNENLFRKTTRTAPKSSNF